MYCPDCGENELLISVGELSVECNHCGYLASFVEYLQRFNFENVSFYCITSSDSRVFDITVGSFMSHGTRGNFYPMGKVVRIKIVSQRPSQIAEAIEALKKAFGDLGELAIAQEGVDAGIGTCPLCGHKKFIKMGNLVCEYCKKFQVTIPDFTASYIEKDGRFRCSPRPEQERSMPEEFYVSRISPYGNQVVFKDAPRIAILEVRTRGTERIVTVKPRGATEEEIQSIIGSLQTLNSIEGVRVVLLKK
ncbi:MAG: hypothetical protein UW68_C0031G0003 [Candidatus Collierbacteria bacterium GW2011_GWB1_44_6]|uniref:Uncharacterized protein n=2 Tax=Candidatus Collieribacteriota TaxID=1752725 RepID=A0A0G1JML3_9BACT|nr:MAG: hypothetical protein UV68_C0044G0008 [Candidatus Collierbacteria bacterium GW2011_GWC2_43_12]KKT72608.1 MAG: hypothetical protein UW68_C0031G0003 [Candidatus Collierbacteria bacterium GW2011_GWB1_44_6]KKT81845.1 MAG: hypothetical protein UW80_C0046G0005 [Microgenomates group bacterium GW2011_GWC1_44_9]